MTPTVLLFDIDGTLVSTGGAGKRARERGFMAATGRSDGSDGFSVFGMTDRQIARTGLQALGLPATEQAIQAVCDGYLQALAEELPKAAAYTVLAGARELLDALHNRPQLAVGLGTGNVRLGAQLKLDRGGLWRYFSFGGFGCDSEDRAELILAGARRGAASLGAELPQCRVWVIGDSQRDVAAAQANGFDSLAVATGGTDADTLRACGATCVVASLADPALVELLAP